MNTLALLYDIILLVIVIIGAIRFKILTIPYKILTGSMLVTLILAISSNIFIFKYKNNAPILHLEAITEFIFYAFTYYYLFTNQRIKKTISILIIIITVFAVINALFLQPFNKVFPTYINVPSLALLVVFSLLLFKEMLLYPSKTPILKQSVFWFNTAIIFYSTTMFLTLGLSNIYTRYRSLDYIMFYFWFGILYIFTILIGIGLLTDNKEIHKTYAP
jgi:hypothetical protein